MDRPFDGSLLHLRGRKILQTLLDVVLVQWGMADTLEQVVLTGEVDWPHALGMGL